MEFEPPGPTLRRDEALMTAEMKRLMNFTNNAARQPFHVAVFTFDDALKDATRIRREKWMFFFFSPQIMLTL